MDGSGSAETRGIGPWGVTAGTDEDDRLHRARRLQRMGTVTIGVSLPREWVGTRNLTVGSTVFLRALADGSLLLQDRDPTADQSSVDVFVEPDRSREHLFRNLVAAYLAGAHEFVIHEKGGITPPTVGVVKSFARRTIQPEIVSEEREVILLRDVSRGGELDIGPLLRRMFQLVFTLQTEAGCTWTEPDRWRAVPWEQRDDEVDRHAWLIERVLALRLSGAAPVPIPGTSLDRPLQTLLLVRALERVGDHAVQIAEHGLRWAETSPPDRILRPVKEFHQQALTQFAAAFRVASEERDIARANDVVDVAAALHATYSTLTESLFARPGSTGLSAIAAVPLGLVLQSIDRTVSYAQDIAEVGLDRSTVVSPADRAGTRTTLRRPRPPPFPRTRDRARISRGPVDLGPHFDAPSNRRRKQEKEVE